MDQPPRDPRRHDLDALRAAAMLGGVWLHASMAYFAIPIWPAQDPNQAPWLETAFHALHGFRMPLFMLLSGFFTCMLWRRRGLGSLLKHRAMRVGLPMLLGLVTVVPLMTWVSKLAYAERFGGGTNSVVEAAKSGEADTLRRLIEGGADPDTTDANGTPAVVAAATFGHAEAVGVLAEAGADVDKATSDGGTALIAAAFFGRAESARVLIAAGADVEAANDKGDTPASVAVAPWAVTEGLAKWLKVPVEREAVESGRTEILAMLAVAGVEVEEPAAYEMPEGGLWLLAAEGQADAIAEAVEGGAEVDALSPDGATPLTSAAVFGQRRAAKALLKAGADVSARNADGGTALHAAAALGRASVVRLLVGRGADPLLEDDAGRTAVDVTREPAEDAVALGKALGLEIDPERLEADRAAVRELMGFPDGEEAVVAGSRDEAAGEAFDAAAREAELEQARRAAEPTWMDRVSDLPKTHAAVFGGTHLAHLWFLNFLLWLVAGFAAYALVAGDWRPPTGLVLPAWRLAWVVPLTAVPAWWMGRTFPVFGPDTSAGWLPAPVILAYYAVFFGFGAWLYEADDRDGRVGRLWWLSLPAALLVVFPAGLEMTYGRWGYRNQMPAEWWRPASVLLQVVYAWLMSFGLVGVFRRLLTRERPAVRYLSDASYWLYLIHLPAVVWGSGLLTEWEAPAEAKLLAVLAGVTGAGLLTYQLLVRYTWVGALLNGRKRRPVPVEEVV